MSRVISILRGIRFQVGHEVLDVAAIYEAHGDFVFASLSRLGVRESDRPDALQDVLIVVHQRLDSWDRESKLTSWLFGICLKIAAKYRRRAHMTREVPSDEPSSGGVAQETPEDAMLERDARARLERVLDGMDLERRAVFVMYELEELSTREIAQQLGVPVGTIHSRLHTARQEFEASLARLQARESHDVRVARGGLR